VAERLRLRVAGLEIPVGSQVLQTTVSIGVVSAYPGDGKPDVSGLLTCADQAMYRAKQAGRNQVAV
jgi:diguanylate cyclase (GGDEF)-like protein